MTAEKEAICSTIEAIAAAGADVQSSLHALRVWYGGMLQITEQQSRPAQVVRKLMMEYDVACDVLSQLMEDLSSPKVQAAPNRAAAVRVQVVNQGETVRQLYSTIMSSSLQRLTWYTSEIVSLKMVLREAKAAAADAAGAAAAIDAAGAAEAAEVAADAEEAEAAAAANAASAAAAAAMAAGASGAAP
jgi:hypothetical protein